MNYVVSSIVLLSIIIIIIYILSVDNNADKFKNKVKELFTAVKSTKINYLNEHDNLNLLNYIKHQLKSHDNITIPTKVYYNKTPNGYEMKDISIVCYKFINNEFKEYPYSVNILFVPFMKDNYISNQSLFGLHGNYTIDIISNQGSSLDSVPVSKPTQEYVSNDELDMIPDVIHLSEEDDSSVDTTDTEALIAHNFE